MYPFICSFCFLKSYEQTYELTKCGSNWFHLHFYPAWLSWRFIQSHIFLISSIDSQCVYCSMHFKDLINEITFQLINFKVVLIVFSKLLMYDLFTLLFQFLIWRIFWAVFLNALIPFPSDICVDHRLLYRFWFFKWAFDKSFYSISLINIEAWCFKVNFPWI